ncbi:MAG: hypothetical protein JWQ71_1786 [Pedosphaera sp.]|nr:hypothetical protein [Pedosphaera sp.]
MRLKLKKEISKNTEGIDFPCLTVEQDKTTLVLFSANAKKLWSLVDINKRDPDKDTGYQRTLSQARVKAIANYIEIKKVIPLSVLISLEGATLSHDKKTITIPDRKDAGWVIDGQHRLAGAHQAKADLEIAIIAFLDLPLEKQIEHFVTINREAKGVPTSLYFDLLPHLPHSKSDSEMSKERAADIANQLKKDETSPFFNRIVVMTSPKRGEMSLNNFVRKVSSLVQKKTGKFNLYTEQEQRKVIDNYYKALEHVFPKEAKKDECIFFQTIGFGALMNILPTIFDLSIKHYKGFRVEDASKILKKVEDFEFSTWKEMGTGTAAEGQAGADIRQQLLNRLELTQDEEVSTIRL